MGQKVNPIAFRLGVVKGWDSNWYGGKKYSEKLLQDQQIRNYLNERIPKSKSGISKVVIERTLKRITITIHTARPGMIIGRGGQEIDKLKEEIRHLTQGKTPKLLDSKEEASRVQINVFEIKRPEIDATLVAENVARQLEARISFRKAMKTALASAMRMGAEGIKILASGRLGGAEMARSEKYHDGRVPLQTLRADVDYALAEAQTVYGKIGVKVWLCKGEIFGKRDLSPNAGLQQAGTRSGGYQDSTGSRGFDKRDDRKQSGGFGRKKTDKR